MKALLILLFVLTSCTCQRTIQQKAYICYEVFPTSNGQIVHRFADFTFTCLREFHLDSVCCNALDTVIIKDYRRGLFGKKLTLFIHYKNQ